MCGDTIETDEESDRIALAEFQENHPYMPDISQADLAAICDPCHLWMRDIERICREIMSKQRQHVDPDAIVNEVPAWMALIPIAEQFSTLPSRRRRLKG
jgi:hypothetical protein